MLVVLSALIHIRALVNVFDWIYSNPQCLD